MMQHIIRKQAFVVFLCFLTSPLVSFAAQKQAAGQMTSDPVHVNSWNRFQQDLYQLHEHLIRTHKIRTEERIGGYAGQPDFYREIKYIDQDSGRLLSRIQWDRSQPDKVHVIEVFIYDDQGRVKRDYLAAFLPEFRNAPIQTLINLHYYDEELHSFRQFDASGARIYEQCQGTFFNDPIFISLDEDDIYTDDEQANALLESEAYLACFEHISTRAGQYLRPLNEIKQQSVYTDEDHLSNEIDQFTQQIKTDPGNASLYLERGKRYFALHDFERAVADHSRAIKLDDKLDEAYFERGMAQGRLGNIRQGIDDISVFIQRNPNHSRAYTKRGVRYLWIGDLDNAEKDFKTAIKLDPANAEAHDDLGVIMANRQNYKAALSHFKQVVKLDPGYQKGFHNLAMTYYIISDFPKALSNINSALQLAPSDKNSLLLKGEILKSMGRHKEANAILENADFLPEGNWSERFSIR